VHLKRTVRLERTYCEICKENVRNIFKERVHPVPEITRLKMLVATRIEILDGQSSCLFSNQPFEKRPGMTIEDFDLHSDDHFESHLLGNGLYHETSNENLKRTVRLEKTYCETCKENVCDIFKERVPRYI